MDQEVWIKRNRSIGIDLIKRNRLRGMVKEIQSRWYSFRGMDEEEWIKSNGSRGMNQVYWIKTTGGRGMDQEKIIRKNETEEEQIKRNRLIKYNYQTILYLSKI